MALFKKQGDNLSRAGAILSTLAPKEPTGEEGKEGAEPAAEVTPAPPVEVQQPTPEAEADTPPAEGNDTPPVEGAETPPAVEGAEGQEEGGVATPSVSPEPPKPVTEPEVVEPEITDDLIFDKLSEMLGREVKSADDLKPAEVDPVIQQILDWKDETGLPLSEWSNYTKDFSQMGDLDVAREILSQQYPNFTKEELDYSLKDYIYDEDVDDEGDRMKKSINLKKFAQQGREKLEANRLKLVESKPQGTLTQEQQDAITFAQTVREQQATVQQTQEAYNTGIANASNSLESIDLKLSDDLTIKYNVPVEVKNNLPKMVAEMPHWFNEDGSYNHSNVVQDVAFVANKEAILQAVYEQGINVGKEGQIKVGANITLDGTPPQTASGEKKGNVDDVVGKIIGGNQKTKLRFGKTKKQ